MKQDKTHSSSGLRALIDELYAKVAKLGSGSSGGGSSAAIAALQASVVSLQASVVALQVSTALALAISKNRAENLVITDQLGVVGGGNIVPPTTLTMVASGKMRVSANASYQTNGSVNAKVSASVNGGPTTVLWSFQTQTGNNTTAANVSQTAVFEFDSAALPGQTVEIFFTSTTGDHALSEFVLGTGDACSGVLLEELP